MVRALVVLARGRVWSSAVRGSMTVLGTPLEAIRDAGVTDVGIVVGDTAPAIEAAVGDGSRFGVKVTYLRQDAPRGLAHGVQIARDFLGDDDFVMYLGDNFIVGGIAGLVEEFAAARPEAQILLAGEGGLQPAAWAELEHVRVTRAFLNAPEAVLRRVLGEE